LWRLRRSWSRQFVPAPRDAFGRHRMARPGTHDLPSKEPPPRMCRAKGGSIMTRDIVIGVITLMATIAGVLPADAKTVKPTKMTCEEFVALGDSVKPATVAYLDGYSKAGKLKEEDIGEVDVDRELAVLIVACKEDPKKTLWDKIRDRLPHGKRKVKPAKMTCQEFVDLDESVRPEAVYWAEGYNKATKVRTDDVGEVDLERDVVVVYEECKQAPKESLWSKIKKHV
jgi:acid stress chaperone HdeA